MPPVRLSGALSKRHTKTSPNLGDVGSSTICTRRSKPVSRVLSSCAASGMTPRTSGVAIIYLGRLLPAGSSDQPGRAAGHRICAPTWSCSGWGLPSQPVSGLLVRSYRTVAPLPVLERAIGGLHFCGTFPEIALAGRYPAPCPVELGLSSRAASRLAPAIARLTSSHQHGEYTRNWPAVQWRISVRPCQVVVGNLIAPCGRARSCEPEGHTCHRVDLWIHGDPTDVRASMRP